MLNYFSIQHSTFSIVLESPAEQDGANGEAGAD